MCIFVSLGVLPMVNTANVGSWRAPRCVCVCVCVCACVRACVRARARARARASARVYVTLSGYLSSSVYL